MKAFAKLLRLCVILFLIAVTTYQTSFAQECDECSRPKIIYYDCDVFVGQQPDSLAPLVFYWPFAKAMDNIISYSPGCVTFVRAALADIGTLESGMSGESAQNLITSPDGGNTYWDYLIRSTITGSEGDYRFSMYLETSPTREFVAGYTIVFTDELQSAKEAGIAIAAEMNPILEKIQSFEREKRDTDTRYAIASIVEQDPREITITPQKGIIDTGETVDIKIKMVDCDGVALRDRKIIFVDTVLSTEAGKIDLPSGTEGGTITPEEAITDESGNVTVQFKAGSEPGVGKIVAWYPHLTPCGHQKTFNGIGMVQIAPPRDDLFVLRANVNYSYSSNSDTTITTDLGGHSMEESKSQFAKTATNGRVIAIIENLAEDPSKDFSYYSDAVEPLSLIVSGSGVMNQFSRYIETIDGKPIVEDIRSDNASGYAIPGASIQFNYTDDDKSAEVGVNIKATGQYTGRRFFYEWSDYGGDYDDYGLIAIAGGSEDNGCSITKLDSTGYNANYSFSESSQEPSLNGTKYVTINKSMTLSIAPYNGLTGVSEEESAQLFPKEFSLSQNYPNPFNPVTSITFQLKSREMVKLKVYDVLGKEVAILAEGVYPQGTYTVQWDATGFPSGVYFYKLQAGSGNDQMPAKKMVVLK